MSVDPQRFFAPGYGDARAAFLRAAERRGAVVASHPIRARGPRGEELAIDTAYFGPDQPDDVLLVTSGVHGVEGFAGSAIQQQLLEAQLDALPFAAHVGVLLVHAVNPWGFAHRRRVNENNVDLNRNFLRHPDEHAPNPDYDELCAAVNPDSLDEESEAIHLGTISDFARSRGLPRLQAALSCGQYVHPRGVQFGGRQEEDSNRIMRGIVRRDTRGARRLLWLDLHTGLGAWGQYEFVSQHELDDPAFVRGRAWFGDKVRSTRSGDSVSALLVGDMLDGAPLELGATCEVSAFAPEFGTWDTLRVFLAMRADNWLQHHGDPESAQGLEIKRELVEVFRPDDREWQCRVLAGGAEILQQAAAALAFPLTLRSGAV
jgi:predicted deacylase